MSEQGFDYQEHTWEEIAAHQVAEFGAVSGVVKSQLNSQPEQQAETWKPLAEHSISIGGGRIIVQIKGPYKSELVQTRDAIIANHQAQQRLQELEAETQVQLIEAEQRIVQAQEELAALRGTLTQYRRAWDEYNAMRVRAETAEAQLATAVAALAEAEGLVAQAYPTIEERQKDSPIGYNFWDSWCDHARPIYERLEAERKANIERDAQRVKQQGEDAEA